MRTTMHLTIGFGCRDVSADVVLCTRVPRLPRTVANHRSACFCSASIAQSTSLWCSRVGKIFKELDDALRALRFLLYSHGVLRLLAILGAKCDSSSLNILVASP